MLLDFEKTMKEAPDAELIRITITNRDDYQEAAIIAAEAELLARNMPQGEIALLKDQQEVENREKSYKAGLPLEFHWKWVAFLLPGIFQLIIAGFFKSNGYDRKANEVGKWTIFGLLFYIGLGIYSAIA